MYLARRPAPPLDRCVELLWYFDAGPAPHPFERLMPGASCELVIELHDERIEIYDWRTLRLRSRSESVILWAIRLKRYCNAHGQQFPGVAPVQTR